MRALGVILIIAAVVVVIAIVLITMSHVVPRVRARRDRKVPWASYCTPVGDQLKVGVHRCTEDGRVLNDVHMRTVPTGLDGELELLVALEEAELRARQYNESKVGM